MRPESARGRTVARRRCRWQESREPRRQARGTLGPVAQRCDAGPQRGPGGPGGIGQDDTGRDAPGLGRCAVQGRYDVDGTTVTDFEEAEHRQQRSVGLALAPLVRGDTKINLLDAPGYADFVGELRAGLRAADCAMFVVAANEGVDEPTRTVWRECAEVGMPRAVVVTKLDHARADYDGVVAQAQDAFGDKVVPVYLREGDQLVGLLTDDHAHDEQRGALIEAVIEESEDETLMDRYLGGEEIDRDLLVADLERAVARGSFHPVVPVDTSTGTGAEELLDLVVSGFPSPLEHPLPEVFTPAGRTGPQISCDPDGPLVAEVVKTTTDPYVGRVSLVRVFSGTIRPEAVVHVSGHFSSFFGERDRPPRPRRGRADRRPVGPAGQEPPPRRHGRRRRHLRDRPALPGRDRGHPVGQGHPAGPAALEHARAAAPAGGRGPRQGRRGQAVPGAAAAGRRGPDAAGRAQRRDPPDRAVVHGRGARRRADRPAGHPVRRRRRPGRAEGAAARDLRQLRARATAGTSSSPAATGSTPSATSRSSRCPRAPGSSSSTRSSAARCRASSSRRSRRASATQMEKGVAAGYPVVDIRVTLTDGKAHSVDSSDMAFQTAGALALREAAAAARINLLEPVDEVGVLVPDDLVGTVMGDLSSRRGRVLGSEPAGDDRTLVRAEVPQLEIVPLRDRPARVLPRGGDVHPDVRALRADAGQHRGQVPGEGRLTGPVTPRGGWPGAGPGRCVSAGAPRSAWPARRTPGGPSARPARPRWRRRPARRRRAPRCWRSSTSRGRDRRGPSPLRSYSPMLTSR